MLLEGKCDFAKWLRDKKFFLTLTYLKDIFSQGKEGISIFEIYDKTKKKLALWKTALTTKIMNVLKQYKLL